mgnify:CR=1 FL=1
MVWEALAARIELVGGAVLLNARVTGITHDGRAVQGVEIADADGGRFHQAASHVVSTMALTHLVRSLGPSTPPAFSARPPAASSKARRALSRGR